jgi:putative SOS response-associated peptidase YedK
MPARRSISVTVNAQVSKLTGSYWTRLLKGDRAVIGASGWYEWTGVKGDKQPWHIHRHDRAPMFILCLANFGQAGRCRRYN